MVCQPYHFTKQIINNLEKKKEFVWKGFALNANRLSSGTIIINGKKIIKIKSGIQNREQSGKTVETVYQDISMPEREHYYNEKNALYHAMLNRL